MLIAKLQRVLPAATPRKRFARALSFSFAVLAAAALIASSTSASAQKKIFAHDDIALSGAGVISTSVTGTVPGSVPPTTLTEKPSTSADLIFSFRYMHSNLVGLEANYAYTRFSEDFSKNSNLPGGAQTNVQEFTFGYLLHAPSFAGLVPFLGAGAGTLEFKPSFKGGLALPTQARMVYYGTVGVDAPITPHFGARAQFRDLIYKAPDYGQNYLTTGQRAQTFEPTIGVYLHF